ncbi:hypothetical protein EOL94_02040 [bacterium]|nr:hypothetical protein [bacterium]
MSFSIEDLKTPVILDYSEEPEKLILNGNFDEVNIKDPESFIAKSEDVKKKVTFSLFEWFGPLNITLLRMSRRSNFETANTNELLMFARLFPDAQREMNIISANSLFYDEHFKTYSYEEIKRIASQRPKLPSIYSEGGKRVFGFHSFDLDPAEERVFLILGIKYEE